MKKVFFLIGAACSGKGTQGRLLNIPVVSAGDILRKMFSNNEKKIQELNNGVIIDPEIVNKAIFDFFETVENNCLIDGYPRTIEQAEFIKQQTNIKKIFIFLNSNCNHSDCKIFSCKKILLERTLSRYFCKICQKTFLTENFCCDEKSIKRKDDTEEIFEKRYLNFHENIYNIINLLSGPFFFINFNQDICIIHREIEKIVTFLS